MCNSLHDILYSMEKAPKNKMITNQDMNTKKSGTNLGKEVKKKTKFYFPQQQRTVEAESREEAEQIINNTNK